MGDATICCVTVRHCLCLLPVVQNLVPAFLPAPGAVSGWIRRLRCFYFPGSECFLDSADKDAVRNMGCGILTAGQAACGSRSAAQYEYSQKLLVLNT